MKQRIDQFFNACKRSPAAPLFARLYAALVLIEYAVCCPVWRIRSRKAAAADPSYRQKVIDEVTFIYKSFERQNMARRLYRCIQRYYPGVRVIIADDSRTPLRIDGPEIIQLPFNSGLSEGLQACLDRVQTKYTVRMDDDQLLAPLTRWEDELLFLETHPEIDLCSVQLRSPRLTDPRKLAAPYFRFTMGSNGKRLRFPIGLQLDAKHYVTAKAPNVFMARTEAYQRIGYDKNIRMLDHFEFFYRASGELACVMNVDSFVYHYHNRFSLGYEQYRSDCRRDDAYIRMKHKL